MVRRKLRTFLRDFGPVKPITHERASGPELPNDRVLTIVEGDSGTPYGVPGFHFVNARGEYYETAKPIVDVDEVFDVWWSDGPDYSKTLPRWEPEP